MLEQYLLDNREAHYRMAFSYIKNKEDALDIVQDSIEKAIRYIDKNGYPEHLNSWFYRVLINTAIDYTRKRQKVTTVEPEFLENFMESEDHYRHFDLEEAIEHLPQSIRTIIVLRYFQDFKLSDIAQIVGENVNTVKTRLYRGLKLLRLELEDEDAT